MAFTVRQCQKNKILFGLFMVIVSLTVLVAYYRSVFILEDSGHTDNCNLYLESSRKEYVFRTNVLQATNIADPNTVTLVTHLTLNRYDKLLDIMQKWTGPISASLYLNETGNFGKSVDKWILTHKAEFTNNSYVHLIQGSGVIYPANHLRNIAMKEAPSSFLFITDVDLVPMPNTYELLHSYVTAGRPRKDEALIVPAFEVPDKTTFDMKDFPRNKSELLLQWKARRIRQFYIYNFKPAYDATDYAKWINASHLYQVQWKRFYEPYVVVRKQTSPKFDRRFVGRAYDKSSYIMLLRALRFKFIVLPDVFIVHTPHSKDNADLFRHLGLYRCAEAVWKEFTKMLKQEYKI